MEAPRPEHGRHSGQGRQGHNGGRGSGDGEGRRRRSLDPGGSAQVLQEGGGAAGTAQGHGERSFGGGGGRGDGAGHGRSGGRGGGRRSFDHNASETAAPGQDTGHGRQHSRGPRPERPHGQPEPQSSEAGRGRGRGGGYGRHPRPQQEGQGGGGAPNEQAARQGSGRPAGQGGGAGEGGRNRGGRPGQARAPGQQEQQQRPPRQRRDGGGAGGRGSANTVPALDPKPIASLNSDLAFPPPGATSVSYPPAASRGGHITQLGSLPRGNSRGGGQQQQKQPSGGGKRVGAFDLGAELQRHAREAYEAADSEVGAVYERVNPGLAVHRPSQPSPAGPDEAVYSASELGQGLHLPGQRRAPGTESAPAPKPKPKPSDAVGLVGWLTHSPPECERHEAAALLEDLLRKEGPRVLQGTRITDIISAALDNAALPQEVRHGALLAVNALVKGLEGVASAEPYVLPLLGRLADALADKSPTVRAEGESAFFSVAYGLTPRVSGRVALRYVLPPLCDAKRHPEAKLALLRLVKGWVGQEPKLMARCLPELVPAVSGCMNDSHTRVAATATELLQAVAQHVGNRDVAHVVDQLVAAISAPDLVVPCVHALGATTFVQAVDAPTLSILVPLLVRGLRERSAAIQRKCCVITDNMAALVEEPADAMVFLPRLAPEVDKVSRDAADPDLRNVAQRALSTLEKVEAHAQAQQRDAVARKLDEEMVLELLFEETKQPRVSASGGAKQAAAQAAAAEAQGGAAQPAPAPPLPPVRSQPAALPAARHAAAQLLALCQQEGWDAREWDHVVLRPCLGAFLGGDASCASLAQSLMAACRSAQLASEMVEQHESDEEEEEGARLCDCCFSLAYGAKTLLNNAQLQLKRGRRYGLVGPNGVGKSTLLRAIANSQVEGFPPKSQLRTVYVEHDIDASASSMAAVEWVYADAELHATCPNVSREEVEAMLSSLGFIAEMQAKPVASLSGGWKMKLALARAMLMRPDLLLLDEPTNHLDIANTGWLTRYLQNLQGVSCIVVSHDSAFLDAITTHIIAFEGRKLRVHKGNLAQFVKSHPEAQAYYNLSAAEARFRLPEPGFLEGVKTKDKAIAKLLGVSFSYPGAANQSLLVDVSGYVTLSSRIAVLGPNGAGKSTLVKLLTGELEACGGMVWRHPNLRIAYVAQHAFHHIESHLDKTPNQYIQWRFATGEDREGLAYASRQLSAEDEARMKAARVALEASSAAGSTTGKMQVHALHGRRKLKRSYEYEVQWVGQPPDKTTWVPREILEELGFGKLVAEVDIKEAAAQGLHARPLTTAAIQQHLLQLGLDPEFTTHSQMRGLSGGQKVKVVLAAATWQCPHVLVLDEPTNYLDRESLGALAAAIQDFGGGVVMISHHDEFTSALCPERWVVGGGTMVREGDLPAGARDKVELKPWENQVLDAFGNTVAVKQQTGRKLTNKERKMRDKMRKARRERGEEVTSSEEEEGDA